MTSITEGREYRLGPNRLWAGSLSGPRLPGAVTFPAESRLPSRGRPARATMSAAGLQLPSGELAISSEPAGACHFLFGLRWSQPFTYTYQVPLGKYLNISKETAMRLKTLTSFHSRRPGSI